MAGGRPTIYKPENAEIARHACMLGATNEALAERFEVCRRTVDNWIATIPEFSDAVRQGRQVADEVVISALFARATGMEQKMTKVFCYRGQPVIANYTVQLPPHVPACFFWLRNRRPAPNKHVLTPSPGVRTQRLPRAPGRQPGADRALAETPCRRAPLETAIHVVL